MVSSHIPMSEVYLKIVSRLCSNKVRVPLPSSRQISIMPQHQGELPGLARTAISRGEWNIQRLEISLGIFIKHYAHYKTCGPKLLFSTPFPRFYP